MNWSRVLLAVPILLLATMAGLSVWAWTHRGYPNAVFYYRMVVRSANHYPHTTRVEVWDDPQRGWMLVRSSFIAGHLDALYRDGVTYDLNGSDAGWQPYPVGPSTQPSRADAALRAGGLAGLASYWYAIGRGHFVYATFDGRPALRYSARQGGGYAMWLDARTHELLAYSVILVDGAQYTDQFTGWARYEPGMLPVGFFDPPGSHPSAWDRALDWVRDRMAGR